MARVRRRGRVPAVDARWRVRCDCLCRGMHGRRSWHSTQLLALVAFEDLAITLVTGLDNRRRVFLHPRFVCRTRETHAAYKIQGLARLKRGHARDLAVGEGSHEGG